VLSKHNLFGKGWTKKQPFPKRLDQKTTFSKKVGPKNNLLRKGWTKKQPFPKRLDQKHTTLGAHIQTFFKYLL